MPRSFLKFWLSLLMATITGVPGLLAQGEMFWFDKPAEHFTESVPMGNGQLGAMFFGGTHEDVVVLCDNGMWSGSPQNADRPQAAEALPEIRRLVFSGKHAAAERLMNEKMHCSCKGNSMMAATARLASALLQA